MRVGLIVDQERLEQEHALLGRLAVGLIGEGVAITRLVPETFDPFHEDPKERRLDLLSRLAYTPRTLPWLRRSRAERLAEAMERAVPDLLHVIGEQAWRFSMDLAHELDRPLLLEIWSIRQVPRVPTGRRARCIAGYLVPTSAIGQALANRVDAELIQVIPPAVGQPTSPGSALDRPDERLLIAVEGEGRDLAAYRDLLGGLRRLADELPQLQVILEVRGPAGHDIWRQARSLDLLSVISSIADAAPLRRLVLASDVLVVPERTGTVRSVMLEAMAGGVPVVAARDPVLDGILGPDSAELVETPSPERWYRVLADLIEHPQRSRQRARTIAAEVQDRFRSSAAVDALLGTYDAVLEGPALPFDAGQGPV